MDALMTIGFINILAAMAMAGASLFDGFRAHKLHISEEPEATVSVPAAIVLKAPPPPAVLKNAVSTKAARHAVRGPNGRFVKKG